MADKKMGPKEAAQRAMRERLAEEGKGRTSKIVRLKGKGISGKVLSLKGSKRGS